MRTWKSDISELFADEARYLHHQLDIRRLTVVLVPAPEPQHRGHMIRAVTEQNPIWYRQMWEEYGRVRRYLSMPSLERLATMRDGNFDPRNMQHRYDTLYRKLMYERLTDGCEDRIDYCHPSREVRAYFGLPPHPLHAREDILPQGDGEEIPF